MRYIINDVIGLLDHSVLIRCHNYYYNGFSVGETENIPLLAPLFRFLSVINWFCVFHYGEENRWQCYAYNCHVGKLRGNWGLHPTHCHLLLAVHLYWLVKSSWADSSSKIEVSAGFSLIVHVDDGSLFHFQNSRNWNMNVISNDSLHELSICSTIIPHV